MRLHGRLTEGQRVGDLRERRQRRAGRQQPDSDEIQLAPLLTVVGVLILALLVIAVLEALIPARQAARISTAAALHTE